MKPILFSAPMVRAITAGRKSQTRRVIKFPEGTTGRLPKPENQDEITPYIFGVTGIKLSPYSVGEAMWVRETWADIAETFPGNMHYKANASQGDLEWFKEEGWKWRPSIFMPREAARLFLRVTSVRAERVQDISTSDCEREGIASDIDGFKGNMLLHHDWITKEYAKLWDSLSAKRNGGEYAWDKSPWVWVVSFERITKEEIT